MNRFWAKNTQFQMHKWSIEKLMEHFTWKKSSTNVSLLSYSVKCVFSPLHCRKPKKNLKNATFSAIFIYASDEDLMALSIARDFINIAREMGTECVAMYDGTPMESSFSLWLHCLALHWCIKRMSSEKNKSSAAQVQNSQSSQSKLMWDCHWNAKMRACP